MLFRSERAEDELADGYQILSTNQIHLARLEETLNGHKEVERGYVVERELDQMRFARRLRRELEYQEYLQQCSADQRSHYQRIRKGKWREVLEDEIEESEEVKIVVATEFPEFVQGSSRDSTPEVEDGRRDVSCLSTPALTDSSGSWSRSPSSSP